MACFSEFQLFSYKISDIKARAVGRLVKVDNTKFKKFTDYFFLFEFFNVCHLNFSLKVFFSFFFWEFLNSVSKHCSWHFFISWFQEYLKNLYILFSNFSQH